MRYSLFYKPLCACCGNMVFIVNFQLHKGKIGENDIWIVNKQQAQTFIRYTRVCESHTGKYKDKKFICFVER